MSRIAYVAPRYAPFRGGVETHVAALATRMAARGHRVEVLTQGRAVDAPAEEIATGVLVRRFPVPLRSSAYPFAPALWLYLARQGHRYDLVHAHGYHALPALGATLGAQAPLIFTPHYHGTGHTPVARLLHMPYRRCGKRIFDRAGTVICVSEAEASLVRSHFPQSEPLIRVIPNGVETEAIRAAPPYPAEGRVILSVGRLEPYKRVGMLIDALALLPETFVLRIIGDGSERDALQARAESRRVAHRVRFLGRVDDATLRRWYRTCHVYVSLSEHEAFGITPREALVAGAAVVASAIPAHHEVASAAGDRVSLLPDNRTPACLAAAIRTIDSGVRGTFNAHTWDEVADQTEELYDALLAPRSAGAPQRQRVG